MSISPMFIAAIQQLATIDFESWAKESFEITTKFAQRNGARIGIPRGGNEVGI